MTHLIVTGLTDIALQPVGRELAERLHLPLRDGDAVLAEATDLEAAVAALQALLQQDSAVLTLGRGALAVPELSALVRQAGPLIGLYGTPALAAGRGAETKVAQPVTRTHEFPDTRETAYDLVDMPVETTARPPAEVTDEVLDWLGHVHVSLGERSYDIVLEDGCHARVGAFLAQLPERVSSVAIISHRLIDRQYGDPLRGGIAAAGLPCHTLLVPAGERYKSLQTASRLYGDLIQRHLDRKSVIVALGGGVIGDLAGFVAATFERGIRFVQVPTSLLAQVDSSVGGKVGVNHPLGKNMIGAFLQPQGVFIDPRTLLTLPKRELRSGLAEVIKYGVIWDPDFFGYLERNVDQILRLDPMAIQHIVRRSCQVKARVVEQDEREANLRAILNYGHTTAHAVETYTSYERYTHGEAVAVGMVVAARIAHALGMLKAEPVHRITRLLERFGLPIYLPKADPGVLMSLMDTDKKAVAGQVRFVLPTAIGRVEIVDSVPRDILRRAIKESLEI
jgi:3-dehydroquinate synthase